MIEQSEKLQIPNHKLQTICNTQIPIYKLQTNSKFQYTNNIQIPINKSRELNPKF